ncbi:MAG: hypothetical protein HY257_11595 [Chloroflexi bacterium]|nr:hypothetical protein [Chloroflexota bacterium]
MPSPETIQQFLETSGLTAIFIVLLLKEIGFPIPIPGDLILLGAAASAAQGRFNGALAFIAIVAPLLLGGAIQYWIARGPGRAFIYRVGKIIGLTKERLDPMIERVRKGGSAAVALGLTTPGVRIATTPASGIADLPANIFLPGLIAGSTFFVAWHFAIGYFGGAVLGLLNFSAAILIAILIAVIALGILGWYFIRRARNKRALQMSARETYAYWAEASCPACITITLLQETQAGKR